MGKRRSLVAPRPTLGPLAERVRDEQVAMLFGRNRVPTLIGIPFSLLIAAVAWADGRHFWIVAWLVVKLGATGARVILDALYFKQPARVSAATWSTRYVVALGVDGFAWSLLILLFSTAPGSLQLAPVMIALACIAQWSLRGRGGDDCLGYTVLANVAQLSAHEAEKLPPDRRDALQVPFFDLPLEELIADCY